MSEIKGRYQVSLCRGRSCCPQLIVENDQYTITDDFGGRIVLTKQNLDELIIQYQDYLISINRDFILSLGK